MSAWSADPDELDATGEALVNLANQSDASLSEFILAMQQLDAQWEGATAEVGMIAIGTWERDAAGLHDHLRRAGGALLEMGACHRVAHVDVKSVWAP
ncbi:MAG: hypothetical protein FWC46_02055 [Actinomycetia bacterium]|nr:hypothetical protein [Actinomycetes bacterium]